LREWNENVNEDVVNFEFCVCLRIWPAHGLGHQVERESGEYFSDDAHAGRFDGEFGAVFVIGVAYFPCGKSRSSINTLEHAR
jgi:hypothetical protein